MSQSVMSVLAIFLSVISFAVEEVPREQVAFDIRLLSDWNRYGWQKMTRCNANECCALVEIVPDNTLYSTPEERIKGCVKVIKVFSGEVTKNKWNYKHQNHNFVRIIIRPERFEIPAYSLFTGKTHLALCRLNMNEKDEKRMEVCLLIPNDWKDFVEEAYKTFKETPDIFKADATKVDDLKELAFGKNPFLAMAAIDTLVKVKQYDVLMALIDKLDRIRLANLVVSLLESATNENKDTILKILHPFIQNTEDVPKIRTLLLGSIAIVNVSIKSEDASRNTMVFWPMVDNFFKELKMNLVENPNSAAAKDEYILKYVQEILRNIVP